MSRFQLIIRRENTDLESKLSFERGESLLLLCQKAGISLEAPCGGKGICGKCRVKYVSGELDSEKTRHISDQDYAEGWRLSCVSTITGDVEVMVPDIASAYKSRMKVADLSSREEIAILIEQRRTWKNPESPLKMISL